MCYFYIFGFLMVHVYYNAAKAAGERSRLEENIWEMQNYLARFQDTEHEFGPMFHKYFHMHYNKGTGHFVYGEPNLPVIREDLLNILSSAIGSLTNPERLKNNFKTVKKSKITSKTIKKYLDCFEDSFKKIVITKDIVQPYYDNYCILTVNIYDFLLDPQILEK